jgi:hypothetical protein
VIQRSSYQRRTTRAIANEVRRADRSPFSDTNKVIAQGVIKARRPKSRSKARNKARRPGARRHARSEANRPEAKHYARKPEEGQKA